MRPEACASETRKAHTLAMLTTEAIDVWVATASAAGAPNLVPVSLAWLDDRVMIDALLEKALDVAADDTVGEAYVAQADWDPRLDAGCVFLVLRPIRVQAWREANEIAGRTLMRDGRWLV